MNARSNISCRLMALGLGALVSLAASLGLPPLPPLVTPPSTNTYHIKLNWTNYVELTNYYILGRTNLTTGQIDLYHTQQPPFIVSNNSPDCAYVFGIYSTTDGQGTNCTLKWRDLTNWVTISAESNRISTGVWSSNAFPSLPVTFTTSDAGSLFRLRISQTNNLQDYLRYEQKD